MVHLRGGAEKSAPSALTRCAVEALVLRSSWWRLRSSRNALMAATISTNRIASVDPHPPKGDTTFHHARHACVGQTAILMEQTSLQQYPETS